MTTQYAAHLGAIDLDDSADGDGITWCTSPVLRGWFEPAIPRHQRLRQPLFGEAFTVSRWRPRQITVDVVAKVASGAALDSLVFTAQETLNAELGPLNAGVLFKVDEPTPKQLTARMAQRPARYSVEGRQELLRARVVLVAADPRKLASSETTSSAGVITNSGDVNADMVITITGAATNPIITNVTDGSRFVQWNGAVGGGTLVIDTRNKTIELNGSSVYEDIEPTSTWPQLRPGANTVTYGGGGTESIAHRDSYI